MSILKAALDYAARGWFVFPAPPNSKKSYKSAEKSGGAKWGMTKEVETIKRDWAKWPKANIGLPTGFKFTVLEIDTKTGHGVDGVASLAMLEKKHGKLPNTLQAESPSGSIHYYFQNIPGCKNSASVVSPGIDVRGEGGMVIAPPSVRPDGVYKWRNNHPILPAPAWLIALVLKKDSNPFLAYGEAKPVKERLENLKAGAVNQTQFSLCATLLNQGMEVEKIVKKVLAETRTRMGSEAAGWNWAKEEQQVRSMCERLLKSREGEGKSADKKQQHIALGYAVIESENIKFTAEGKFVYRDGLWQFMEDDRTWKEWVNSKLEAMCVRYQLVSTNRLISEARGWIERQPDLLDEDVKWDVHGKVPVRNGLIDVKTGALTASEKSHHCTYRLDVEYDKRAKCPHWLRLLHDMFDEDTIGVIQEHLGAGLLTVKPKALHKALVFVGAANTGKTEVISVLAGLFGDKTIGATFDSLEGSHGTMPFLRRAPWVLQEAFDSGRWHITSVVKQLISGEGININIKNGKILSHVYRSPIFWGTNTPPQFKESGRAMVERLTVIRTSRVFGSLTGTGKAAAAKGHGKPSALVLAEERAGLLNWALLGAQRAIKNGVFTKTKAIEAASHEFYRESNLVLGFIEDCVEFDEHAYVTTYDFKAAYDIWWNENRGETSTPSPRAVGKHLSALADARIISSRSNSTTFYNGIKLNKAGLDLWQTAFNVSSMRGGAARLSSAIEDVNMRRVPTLKRRKTPVQETVQES